jgi:cytochrome c5
MKKSRLLKTLVQKLFAVVAITALTGGLAATLFAAEPDAATNAAPSPASAPAAKPQLTGAELYSIHCNRCHPERYPTERTAAQWKTILLHMQVRASIPGKQARQILQYLQENSGR